MNTVNSDLQQEKTQIETLKFDDESHEKETEGKNSKGTSDIEIKQETGKTSISSADRKSSRKYIEIKNETESASDNSEGNKRKRTCIIIQKEGETSENEPNFVGYQLVGDSQFCRFGQQILGLERTPTPNGNGRIGICVSGQTIAELHQRVKDKFYPVGDKIILMIGTNDFLQNAGTSTMCQQLSSLVRTLMKEASSIILLTLPPVPKLAHEPEHWSQLEKFNKHIQSLCDGNSIKLGDISHLYQHPKINKCQMYLFETYFPGRKKRLDMIHLNKKDLRLLETTYLIIFNFII